MNGSDVTTVIQRLRDMSYQERANNNCISVERADLVLAAAPFWMRSAMPSRYRGCAVSPTAACARACWSTTREDGALGVLAHATARSGRASAALR